MLPGGSDGKESACNVGDSGSIPELGKSPGEGMGTHASILTWKIPWTEEPGGLQSTGSQRVRHDLARHKLLDRLQGCVVQGRETIFCDNDKW